MRKNVVATTSLGEYKDFLRNKKDLRGSMNRIQNKDDQIYILNNGYNGLTLRY